MRKRLLSILIALCLTTQFVPTTALAAQAEAVGNTLAAADVETPANNEAEQADDGSQVDGAAISAVSEADSPDSELVLASTESAHNHRICGDLNCSDSKHAEIKWTAWTSANSLPTISGNYYLTTDVTLTKPWDCKQNVNLCLNGHSIYGAEEPDEDGSRVIRVALGANLAITDCHTGDQVGKITYKNDKKHGGIDNKGTLALWNGSITGNAMNGHGGGVYNNGTFTMYGGSICGNSASGGGGGVYNNGTFTMSGGSICGNSSTSYGGGVYDDGTFTMSGGSITDNSSTGGVFIGEFAGHAGGVYVMGTLNLSGDVVIKDNKAGNTVSNVEIEIATTTVSRYGTVAVTGPMGKNASVGITATEPSEKLTVVKGTTNTDAFFSDDGTYTLVADEANKVLYMVLTSSIPQEHKICGDATCQDQDHAILTWKAVWSLDEIKEGGNYYLLSDLTLGDTWTCNYDVNLCLNGKTITGPADKATIRVAAGSSLTITDCHTGDQVGKITHNNGEAGNGIFIASNDDSYGTLTLWNGSIAGNSSEYGGVENYGTLNICGGSITGNKANSYGGGVYNSGTLSMSGGSIAKNSAGNQGGGVYVSYGSLTMSGGSITGNSASYGGGVYNRGALAMSGGSITGNKANSYGGGLYNFGTFSLSGEVAVKDNTVNGAANNVYLSSGKTITVAEVGMGERASVGITAQKPEDGPVVVSGATDSKGFFSDAANYELVRGGDRELKLSAGPVRISGVKLLASDGGDELAKDQSGARSKAYDGAAVAYGGGSCTPDGLTDVTLTYAWQVKSGGGYADIAGNAAPSDAGSYRLLVTAKRDGAVLDTSELPFTIAKRSVTIADATVAEKTYDGTTDAKVTGVTFGNLVEGETLALGSDYTVTGAKYDGVNATGDGAATKATFSVALADTAAARNYTLASGSGEKAATIKKATAQKRSFEAIGNHGVENACAVPAGYVVDGGKVAVSVERDDSSILDGTPTCANGTLTYKLKDSATSGQTATVKLSVTSANYDDYAIVATLGVTDKEDDPGSGKDDSGSGKDDSGSGKDDNPTDDKGGSDHKDDPDSSKDDPDKKDDSPTDDKGGSDQKDDAASGKDGSDEKADNSTDGKPDGEKVDGEAGKTEPAATAEAPKAAGKSKSVTATGDAAATVWLPALCGAAALAAALVSARKRRGR